MGKRVVWPLAAFDLNPVYSAVELGPYLVTEDKGGVWHDEISVWKEHVVAGLKLN